MNLLNFKTRLQGTESDFSQNIEKIIVKIYFTDKDENIQKVNQEKLEAGKFTRIKCTYYKLSICSRNHHAACIFNRTFSIMPKSIIRIIR